jgi:hypothetical protein
VETLSLNILRREVLPAPEAPIIKRQEPGKAKPLAFFRIYV